MSTDWSMTPQPEKIAKPGRFWERVRRNGWLYSLSMLFHRVVPGWLLTLRAFIVIRLERESREKGSQPQPSIAATARRVGSEDLPALRKCGHPEGAFRYWLESGARGWMIEREGSVQACYWLDPRDCYSLYPWLVLRSLPTDFWVSWWWVAPEARGTRLACAVRLPGIEELRREGFSRRLGVIDRLNRNAIRAARSSHSRPMRKLLVLRLLGLTVVYSRWRFHVRVGSKRSIEIDVDRSLGPDSLVSHRDT